MNSAERSDEVLRRENVALRQELRLLGRDSTMFDHLLPDEMNLRLRKTLRFVEEERESQLLGKEPPRCYLDPMSPDWIPDVDDMVRRDARQLLGDHFPLVPETNLSDDEDVSTVDYPNRLVQDLLLVRRLRRPVGRLPPRRRKLLRLFSTERSQPRIRLYVSPQCHHRRCEAGRKPFRKMMAGVLGTTATVFSTCRGSVNRKQGLTPTTPLRAGSMTWRSGMMCSQGLQVTPAAPDLAAEGF